MLMLMMMMMLMRRQMMLLMQLRAELGLLCAARSLLCLRGVCEMCVVCACMCVLLLVGCRCLVVFKLKIPDLHTVTDALNLHLSKCIKSKRAH